MTFPKIIFVKPIEKYRIQVKFDDGINGIYDVGHLAGKGVFKKWDTDQSFDRVLVDKESGAVTWPGIADIDTLMVYCKIRNIDIEEFLYKNSHAAYL